MFGGHTSANRKIKMLPMVASLDRPASVAISRLSAWIATPRWCWRRAISSLDIREPELAVSESIRWLSATVTSAWRIDGGSTL